MSVVEKVNVADIFAAVMAETGVSDELPLGAWDVLVKTAFAGEKKNFGEETPAVTFKLGLVAPVSGAPVSPLALREKSPMYYDVFISRLQDLGKALSVLADLGFVAADTVEAAATAYLGGKDFLKVIGDAVKGVEDVPAVANLTERKYYSKKEGRQVRTVEVTRLSAVE